MGEKEKEKGSVKIEDLTPEEGLPRSYKELVARRLREREKNIMANIAKMEEDQLRFTVRIFADCMEEEEERKFLDGYTEYMPTEELRKFVEEFVPAYTDYAVRELEEKKKRGEDFEPEHITGEELQEMALKEKWPRIAAKPQAFSRRKLIREIAKVGLCLRPYMITDPAWNESVLEYSLYYDLQEKLSALTDDELHGAAREIGKMVGEADSTRVISEKEKVLSRMREFVLSLAGMSGKTEELLGPPMERYPREAPPEWELLEFRYNLQPLSLHELQMSALVYLEMLTAAEAEELSRPFMEKHSSFFDMDKETLIDFICTLVYAIGDREILNFFERYTKGKMMVIQSFARETWNLLPYKEKLAHLRRDNAEMDLALMARHIARIFMSPMFSLLYNYDFQIDLIKNPDYLDLQAYLVRDLGGRDEGAPLVELNDWLTKEMLDLVNLEEGIRERFAELRRDLGKRIGGKWSEMVKS
ncbi:MAG: hypothetical protein D6713_01410 [Deltaproteobacteria bacterium]|nr:MAG: hypothetical protein D6713_01410 [Deltaproteobacteria bacterium]